MICLAIHTERLHDDRLWRRVKTFVKFLNKNKIQVVWFSINPSFKVYREMGYSEEKWIERLRYLFEQSQLIEQHSHFYQDKKDEYNFSEEHLKKRLVEDKNWLERQGFSAKGFVSGGWRANKELLGLLEEAGFEYDCSARVCGEDRLADRPHLIYPTSLKVSKLWEMPTLAFVKHFWRHRKQFNYAGCHVIYLHDYDLADWKTRIVLKILVKLYRRYGFITTRDWVDSKKRIKIVSSNYQGDSKGGVRIINSNIYLHPHDHKKRWDWRVILRFLSRAKIKPQSVLDLGGGAGNIAHYYASRGSQAVVEDLNMPYLEAAVARHKNISGLAHDINSSLPFAGGSFDLVCCLGTLHYSYIKDRDAVLREMARVSRKYILIDFLSDRSWWIYIDKLLHPRANPKRFSPGQVNDLLNELGLKAISLTSTRAPALIRKIWPFKGKAVIILAEKK